MYIQLQLFRFVPPSIQAKYGISGLHYGPGPQQVIKEICAVNIIFLQYDGNILFYVKVFNAPLAEQATQNTHRDSSWQLHVSPEGYLYYYNAASGQSEWARFEGSSTPSLAPPNDASPSNNAVKERIVTVMATFPNRELAESIARHLVSEELAACAQLMNGMTSFYKWQGVAEESTEVVMIVKVRVDVPCESTKSSTLLIFNCVIFFTRPGNLFWMSSQPH
jgi:hypothetical protein